jgi:hypothetical protein
MHILGYRDQHSFCLCTCLPACLVWNGMHHAFIHAVKAERRGGKHTPAGKD